MEGVRATFKRVYGGYIGTIYRVYGHYPKMENQMEKKMEHDMEIGTVKWNCGIRVSKNQEPSLENKDCIVCLGSLLGSPC